MPFDLWEPRSAESVQIAAAGFLSFGVGRKRPLGYGVDVAVAYIRGGQNYPEVAPTIGAFGRLGWGGAAGATFGARGGVRWMDS